MMLPQAVELGDTGRQVVLWVAMGLALWQLILFAASTLVQGKNLGLVCIIGNGPGFRQLISSYLVITWFII